MKLNNGKSLNHALHTLAVFPTALLGVGLSVSAPAVHATIAQPEEIVVTARRTEEVIQNVPISMTVFNQDMLNERNVVNGADLAAYTPSLNVDTRFGSDQASFAIRGFTQEFRTTASVAVYFADVVAPRGSGSQTAGDGAGPGAFFDLQNVQVLKGPQGTLFGRNTTGGAIQLIPQEPTSKLEGYLEQSVGNYNMRRTQGVLNVPISDMARARFGFDTQQRDGYLNNKSGIGPDDFANINYQTYRASLMLDLTDKIQNYTIGTYTNSQNNGNISGMFACGTAAFGSSCQATLDHQGTDFYSVENYVDDPTSKLKQWQIINRTTWDVNDNFTVKNNISYADLETHSVSSIFGTNFHLPNLSLLGSAAGASISFFPSGEWPGIPANSQTTFVEELQFSGTGLSGALTWQGGLYYENSKPDGLSGSLSAQVISCDGKLGSDPNAWNCFDATGPLSGGQFAGSVQSSIGKTEFTNKAAYAQSTYDISDEFRVTTGARYTVDETDGQSDTTLYYDFPSGVAGLGNGLPPGGPGSVICVNTGASLPDCKHKSHQKSEAPTWLIDFDYLPTPDVMAYMKYARGYRQGSVNIYAPDGLQFFGPEKVDAYELGAKTSFRAPVSGTFNIALFYNELSNQQIQAGYVPITGTTGSATTAIINAGASTIQGVEAETTLKLTNNLVFNLGYTYLETHVDSLSPPPPAPAGVIQYQAPFMTAVEGGHLSFSPRHNVTLGLSYSLPVPKDIGDISVGGTYTYVSEQIATADRKYGTLDERNLLNLNAGWKAIMGSAFDAGLFVTNATDEKITAYTPGLYEASGAEFRTVLAPRMYGARLKYNFGL